MRLTDGQYWSGLLVMLLAIFAIVAGFMIYWRKVDRDILKEDRKRLKAWAEDYAERLAQRRFRDYVKNLRITLPIELINESDIKWGDDSDK